MKRAKLARGERCRVTEQLWMHTDPDDLTWALHVQTPDPRVCFTRIPNVAAGGGSYFADDGWVIYPVSGEAMHVFPPTVSWFYIWKWWRSKEWEGAPYAAELELSWYRGTLR